MSLEMHAKAKARLFERFYRGDDAHGRRVEGVGLGLSVSREIARAHVEIWRCAMRPLARCASA